MVVQSSYLNMGRAKAMNVLKREWGEERIGKRRGGGEVRGGEGEERGG